LYLGQHSNALADEDTFAYRAVSRRSETRIAFFDEDEVIMGESAKPEKFNFKDEPGR